MPVEVTGILSHRMSSEDVAMPPRVFDKQVMRDYALAHEASGFDRVLIAQSSFWPDSMPLAAYLAGITERLGFMVAHRPGFVSPTMAARMFATLDQLSDGRAAIHVITAANDRETQCDGDFLTKEQRYHRSREFVEILRRIWAADAPISHEGRFFRFNDALSEMKPFDGCSIPVFWAGGSDISLTYAGQCADIYSTGMEAIAVTRTWVARAKQAATDAGRDIAVQGTVRIILGETENAAWDNARIVLEKIVANGKERQRLTGQAWLQPGGRNERELSNMVNASGVERFTALTGSESVIDERLWAGPQSIGIPMAPSLVGTPEQVAAAMMRYYELGMTGFLFRGFDLLADTIERRRSMQPMSDRGMPDQTPGFARAPLSLAIAWGSGSFSQSLVIYGFGVLLFRYYTDTVGIAAALAGSMIGLSKLYDAVINPGIGWLTDRIETPMGRRRPWLLLGGTLMAASLVVTFNIPIATTPTTRMARAAFGLFLFSSGYSLFAIPWLAMPPEISEDPAQRTQMMAWRVGFSSLAQGASSLTGPMLLAALGSGVFAYGVMGWTMGSLCFAAVLGTVYFTRNAPQRAVERAGRPSVAVQLRLMWENRPFLVMVAVKMFLYFGLAFNSGAMALLTRWVMHLSDAWLGSFTLVSTLAALLSQPVWLWVDGRVGKRGALTIAFLVHGTAQASLYFNTGLPAVLVTQAILLGAGGGGVFMLSQSLLPEVIEHDYQRTGLRRGGTFAGVVAFLETGASAFAIFAMGLLLSSAGYVQGLATVGTQPDSAIAAIRLSAAILPTVAEIVAILLLTRYRLNIVPRRAVMA